MVVFQFISHNLCLFVSINSGSNIFARECHKLGASWGSCLSQWASSFSSGSSPIWEFQVVKMRDQDQSSIFWRSRKHQPTSLLFIFVIYKFCKVNYPCRLSSELKQKRLNRCLLLDPDPFCKDPLYEPVVSQTTMTNLWLSLWLLQKKVTKKIHQKQLLFMSLSPGHGTKYREGEGGAGRGSVIKIVWSIELNDL